MELYRLNWDGLQVGDVIKQSVLIHPDWTVQDHRAYLLGETTFRYQDLGLDRTKGEPEVTDTVTHQCVFPGSTCLHRQMPGQKLCLEHFVNVARLMAPAPGHSW